MNPSSVVQFETQQNREPDLIRVFLKECRIMLSIGHSPSERLKKQEVIVTIEAEALLPHHYQDVNETSLDRVIDYVPFYDYLHNELPRLGHIPLLETVAEHIITFCFGDRRIQKVRVKLEKPEVFQGMYVGIDMCRTRPKE